MPLLDRLLLRYRASTDARPARDDLCAALGAVGARQAACLEVIATRVKDLDRGEEGLDDLDDRDASAAARDLLALTRRRVLRWRPEPPPTVSADADEAALQAAVDELESSWAACEAVLDDAVTRLGAASRVVLSYGLLSWDDFLAKKAAVVVPRAPYQPRRASLPSGRGSARRARGLAARLDQALDRQMEEIARDPDTCFVEAEQVPFGAARMRWAVKLWRAEQAVTDHRHELQRAWQAALGDVRQALATRRRRDREARRSAAKRAAAQRDAELRGQAEELEAASQALLEDARALHARLNMSGKELRAETLYALLHGLRTGIDHDEHPVARMGDDEAREVLRFLTMAVRAVREAPDAAARLRGDLEKEAALVRDAEALGQVAATLPTTTDVGRARTDIPPRLRNGCAWLDANWEGLRPLAVTIAPTAARLLGRLVQALREDPPT